MSFLVVPKCVGLNWALTMSCLSTSLFLCFSFMMFKLEQFESKQHYLCVLVWLRAITLWLTCLHVFENSGVFFLTTRKHYDCKYQLIKKHIQYLSSHPLSITSHPAIRVTKLLGPIIYRQKLCLGKASNAIMGSKSWWLVLNTFFLHCKHSCEIHCGFL